MTSTNRITDFEYTLDGQLAGLIARNAVTGDQVTRWHYGTTLEENGVASNSLARAKVYPESDDAGTANNGPDTAHDRVEYRYNRLESVGFWSTAEPGQGVVVNQVQLRFNGFGQLTDEDQIHEGPVVADAYAERRTGTSGTSKRAECPSLCPNRGIRYRFSPIDVGCNRSAIAPAYE